MIKDPCLSCGASDYFYYRAIFGNKGERYDECSQCSKGSIPSLSPDVFFDKSKGANQTDPNLVDRYKGKIPFSSKREKAAILKRLKLREAGDKEHGSRVFDKKASKQWDNK